ncbi:MAG: AAA domain-containing protein [Spirochaetes bacterium]|jgi:MoxR-like ATPase|nr:AAA domain-containing protein [Spirochaetota bacterium]
MDNVQLARASSALASRLVSSLSRVIRGKDDFLRMVVSCLITGGHLLIEDVPGLGKTTVAKTLAALISPEGDERDGEGHVTFRRIQFTPDLLPYDITGVDIFDPDKRAFVFSPGPVFANIVLADEINRSTPKVQSALLEVMAEGQVTVGGHTYKMDDLFFVMGTQNPVEVEGTYPLPLAQLDRFLMRLEIGYPASEVELAIVKDDPSVTIMPTVEPVCTRRDILEARQAAREVHVDDSLYQVVVDVARSTRDHRAIEYGVSPRGSLMLIHAARAFALVNDRTYVVDQDIIDLAPAVLGHRIRLQDARTDPRELIREVTLSHVDRLHS